MYVGLPILAYSSWIAILLCKMEIEAAVWLAYQRRPYFLKDNLPF